MKNRKQYIYLKAKRNHKRGDWISIYDLSAKPEPVHLYTGVVARKCKKKDLVKLQIRGFFKDARIPPPISSEIYFVKSIKSIKME
jgi:hypothetical protein